MTINKLYLIGNGFDLAHGLKTSYRDFINWCCRKLDAELNKPNCNANFLFDLEDVTRLYNGNPSNYILKGEINDVSDFKKYFDSFKSQTAISLKCIIDDKGAYIIKRISKSNNFFFSMILDSPLDNWGGVEWYYYQKLKAVNDEGIVRLQQEFEIVKSKLQEYLSTQVARTYFKNLKCSIDGLIKFNILPNDIQKKLLNDIIANGDFSSYIAENYKEHPGSHESVARLDDEKIIEILEDDRNLQSRLLWNRGLDNNPLNPETILLLDFNYTSTVELYTDENQNIYMPTIKHLHIHGALKNDKKTIIFGYGDELDPFYKNLEDKNNNRYLLNSKSVGYIKTANYNKLLQFIEAEKYVVYILGHSCATSDRTLLNMIFENQNCISIYPYYHKINDTANDFDDIVMNISRCFNKKTLMRERVVDFSRCVSIDDIIDNE